MHSEVSSKVRITFVVLHIVTDNVIHRLQNHSDLASAILPLATTKLRYSSVNVSSSIIYSTLCASNHRLCSHFIDLSH